MERLIKLLANNKSINDYRISEEKIHSYQLFFVKKRLETNRVSDSDKIEVTVYVDVDKYRGAGSFIFHESDSDEEVIENMNEAVFNAKLALNPYYELPKAQEQPIELKSNFADRPFKDIAEDVAKAIFSNEMDDTLYSAATEIFINRAEKRIINSQGLDNKEVRYYGEVELIPSYDTKEKEVEIYHMMRFSNFDFEAIKNEAKEVLTIVKDRYNAIDLPKGLNGTNIIIDGYEVADVFEYFNEDLLYSSKFTQTNLCELDNNIQGEIKGSTLTLTMMPYYKGASASRSMSTIANRQCFSTKP